VRRGRRVIALWNPGGRVGEQVLMRYLASSMVFTGNSARRRRQTRGVLTASLTYSIHRLDPLGALSGASNGSSDHLGDHLDEARNLASVRASRDLLNPLAPPGGAPKGSAKYCVSCTTLPGGVGHNLPQEAPQDFAKAVVDVNRY
jgi:hypothetical protein